MRITPARAALVLVLIALTAPVAAQDAVATPGATAAEPVNPGIGFRLANAKVKPKQAYFDGKRPVSVRYRFRARRTVSLKVLIVRARSGRAVARLRKRDARPGSRLLTRWNGITTRGRAASDGRYEVRIGPVGPGPARYAGRFRLRGHAFPVQGNHGTRGAIGEFGAPRNGGRTHEGFDITAACGTRLVAARGGRVRRAGYDPRLYGYYVLIAGRKTNESYFYSHMLDPGPLRKGDRVRTGGAVGRVGQTGNAQSTPCHLHFELRRGGQLVDPERALSRWDG